MMPIPVSHAASTASQPTRSATVLPAAPAPAPLAAPAMVARVEWAGAVRPPDALLRAYRPEHEPRADPDLPTGPPPAFSANLLDQIPDTLKQALETVMEPPQDPEGEPAAPAGDGPWSDPQTAARDPDPGALPKGDAEAAPRPARAEAVPTTPPDNAPASVGTGQRPAADASGPSEPPAAPAEAQLARAYALMTAEETSRVDRSL